jgi:hypothetical protein
MTPALRPDPNGRAVQWVRVFGDDRFGHRFGRTAIELAAILGVGESYYWIDGS